MIISYLCNEFSPIQNELSKEIPTINHTHRHHLISIVLQSARNATQ